MTKPALFKRAVIAVFDGLRPDRVTTELTPNICRFAQKGIWFRESRSVFPSVTRVATASFATGSKPTTHGIMNNKFLDPTVTADRMIDTSFAPDLRKAEDHYGGRFVEAEGLGCALARAGKSFAVVHTGSAGSAYLANHKALAHGHWTFSIHGTAYTQTPAAVEEVVDRFGPLPESAVPKFDDVDYGADVLIEHVLKTRRPDVALIWFSEPDTSYHFREIGSDDSSAIVSRVDEHFGRILDAVRARPDAEETLIVAMSDHGHITTEEHVDVHGMLTDVGLSASDHPGHGIDLVAGLGITLDLTLKDKTPARVETIANTLMAHPMIGHLFSRSRSEREGEVPGTLPYSLVGTEHVRAAHLVCVLRSSSDRDQHGLPGKGGCTTPIDVPLGGGMHGGLNPFEQNTLLAFGGADLPELGPIKDPADLTDIVPTLLALMDVPIPKSITGAPLAAVTGNERPDSDTKIVSAGRDGFEQRVTLATGSSHPVVLCGDRVS
ncbi:MAG: alkaline phosphatase family protein [Pseudomonadota bacterium]